MKIGQKRAFFYIIVWIFAIHLNSCKRDFEKFNWDTDLTLPIAYGKLGLNNLIPDSILQNNGGNFSLNIEKDLISLDIEKLVSIPDTTIDTIYTFPFNLNFDPGFIYYNKTEKTKLNLAGAQITNAVIKKGKILFKISTTLKERSLVTFKMNCASKNGQQLTFSDWIEKSDGNIPIVYSKDIDLSGYSLNLKGSLNNSYNEIYYQIIAQTDPNGVAVIFEPDDYFKMETAFIDLAPEYMKGYFGNNNSLIGPEKINLDLFNKIQSGNINLTDAKLDLKIINRIGADFKLNIKNIKSLNSKTNAIVDLSNSELINNTLTVNRAKEDNFGIYPPVTPFVKEYHLNNSNSNIISFIENLPSELQYELSFDLNPMGNLSGGSDFVYFDKPFEAKMNLNIPLNFKLDQLVLIDTIDMKNALEDKEKIKSAKASFVFKNNFPFSIKLKLYTMDSLGNMNTVPLYEEQEIKSAETDNAGNILNPSEQELNFFIEGKNLVNLISKGKLYIVARANSPQNSNTIITDKCYIEYKHKLQLVINNKIGEKQ